MWSTSSSTECGIGFCKPRFMQRFAQIPWFICFYSISGLVTSSITVYIVSQITTIEKQFALSSTKSGYLMACNDIGYCAFVLVASYLANRVHVPRFLGLSATLYGVSSILCCVPHFLYKPEPLSGVSAVKNKVSNAFTPEVCTNSSDQELQFLTDFTNNSVSVDIADEAKGPNDARSSVAMAFIAIGMIVQGLGKAPRAPMIAQYIDDNSKPRETGFFMGIITSLSIFGPAIAYGLGGVFSQIYVTLEDVDLHPRDPRWIGAWWLGFLVFGVIAIVSSLPLFLFPANIRAVPGEKSRTQDIEVSCSSLCSAIADILKSIVLVMRNPSYVLMLMVSIINIIGFSAGMAFGPKYLEVHFNMPAHQSNYVLAGWTVISICFGSFLSGVLTKKVRLTPRSCTLVILIPQIPSLLVHASTLFLKCDQPQIHNWPSQSSTSLPESCSSSCSCENNFLPVCDGAGTNYFSPCHAGCSNGSMFKFTNCSCIPGSEATTGLCKFDCNTLWPYLGLNLLSTLTVSIMTMPAFMFNIRIVEDKLKSMSIGISHLCMSLFAWLPGPVIGGKIVDQACLLWSDYENNEGSCRFYDIDRLRYSIIGIAVACRTVGVILIACILCFTWNMSHWPNTRDEEEEVAREKELGNFTKIQPKPDALISGSNNKKQEIKT